MKRTAIIFGIVIIIIIVIAIIMSTYKVYQQAYTEETLILRADEQLVACNMFGVGFYAPKAYLFDPLPDASYSISWISRANTSLCVEVGDVDNDGTKEIISSWEDSEPVIEGEFVVGIIIRNLALNVWENGSLAAPTLTSSNLTRLLRSHIRDIVVADANNDRLNEVVLACGNCVAVFIYNPALEDFEPLWTCMDPDMFVWQLSIGDADNDGLNEIVGASARQEDGCALVWEYKGSGWECDYKTDSLGQAIIDVVRIGDVDDDGFNELVGGGNFNAVSVWKFNGTDYPVVWMSEDLGGFTQGLGIGDFDGDGKEEIATGTAENAMDGKVYVIKHDGTKYNIIWSYDVGSAVNVMDAGDLDNDGKDEFVVCGRPVSIFKWEGDSYSLVWSKVVRDTSMSHLAIG